MNSPCVRGYTRIAICESSQILTIEYISDGLFHQAVVPEKVYTGNLLTVSAATASSLLYSYGLLCVYIPQSENKKVSEI